VWERTKGQLPDTNKHFIRKEPPLLIATYTSTLDVFRLAICTIASFVQIHRFIICFVFLALSEKAHHIHLQDSEIASSTTTMSVTVGVTLISDTKVRCAEKVVALVGLWTAPDMASVTWRRSLANATQGGKALVATCRTA